MKLVVCRAFGEFIEGAEIIERELVARILNSDLVSYVIKVEHKIEEAISPVATTEVSTTPAPALVAEPTPAPVETVAPIETPAQ